MSKENVQKKGKQIKLVFGEGTREFKRFDVDAIAEELGLEMESLMMSSGLLMMRQIMAREEEFLAGKRHNQTSEVDRWGRQKGYVVLGGQKVPTKRPRLRNKQNQEVVLESYRRFQCRDDRTEAVYRRMVHGVSCRNYPETIEQFAKGYGISKSVVSREMVEATQEQLEALLERDLSSFELCVLFIDGVWLGDTVFLVALGVDVAGKKQVMGFREGGSENTEVCTGLLEDLVKRGIRTDNTILAVLDGAKALRSGVRRVFGERTPIQRCQIHKLRNVVRHLPDRYHGEFTRKIQAAYKMRTYADAKRALETIIKELNFINHSAAASLAEGLEESITVHRMDVPEGLRKSFYSTNIIESTFSRNQAVMKNVKRWQNSSQKHRWLAATLHEGEIKYRKLHGYRSMPLVVSALDHIVSQNALDSQQRVA